MAVTSRTLNKRGGIIGDRFVKNSLIMARIKRTTPITNGAIVAAWSPG